MPRSIGWLAMAAGIALAGLAQWQSSIPIPSSLFQGWLLVLLFGAAALLFVLGAAPPRPTALSSLGWPWTLGDANLPRSLFPALLLSLLLGGLALNQIWQDFSSPWGLGCWVLSMLALLVSVWPLGTRTESAHLANLMTTSRGKRIHWPEWLLLALIVLGAALVRFWDLDLFPSGLQSDEGNNGMEALKWLAGSPYMPYSEINEGQASLFTYLIALSLKLGGVNLTALRATSIVVGVVTVLSFFFLVRDHFGAVASLAGTALLAFSRWHITFSRIVYELILVPLATIWLFASLHRGLRDGRPRDFVLAGLAMALGLNTYTAFRVMPLGVLLLFVYWLLTQRQRFWVTVQGGLLFVFSSALGLIPLAIYTWQRWDVVMIRTRRLNLLNDIAAAGTLDPLWFNLRSYALMFTIRGDPGAINNLPDQPMLSAMAGILFLLGAAYVLCYWRRPSLFLPLAMAAGALPAGVFSVILESPSSRRVIGVLPALFFAVSAMMDGILRTPFPHWGRRIGLPLAAVLILFFVSVASFQDVRFFFTRQAINPEVQMGFSPVESAIGRTIRDLPPKSHILLHPDFRGHSAIRFIAHEPVYDVLEMANHLPLSRPLQRPVIYFLPSADSRLRFLFEYYYPGGQWQAHRAGSGALLFNTFTLDPTQQSAPVGLTLAFYPDQVWTNAPVWSGKTPGIGPGSWQELLALMDMDFLPQAGVVWRGSLRVESYGRYTISVHSQNPYLLLLDGETILTDTGTDQASRTLMRGFHAFELRGAMANEGDLPQIFWQRLGQEEQEIPASAYFSFAPPPYGLLGRYYANRNWEGDPISVQQDVVVASTDLFPSPYSVYWQGHLLVDRPGLYHLGALSDDGSWITVNGQLVMDNGGRHGAEYREGQIELTAGSHPIQIRYFQDSGSHKFELFWRPPGAGQTPIPPDHLLPVDLNDSDG